MLSKPPCHAWNQLQLDIVWIFFGCFVKPNVDETCVHMIAKTENHVYSFCWSKQYVCPNTWSCWLTDLEVQQDLGLASWTPKEPPCGTVHIKPAQAAGSQSWWYLYLYWAPFLWCFQLQVKLNHSATVSNERCLHFDLDPRQGIEVAQHRGKELTLDSSRQHVAWHESGLAPKAPAELWPGVQGGVGGHGGDVGDL